MGRLGVCNLPVLRAGAVLGVAGVGAGRSRGGGLTRVVIAMYSQCISSAQYVHAFRQCPSGVTSDLQKVPV